MAAPTSPIGQGWPVDGLGDVDEEIRRYGVLGSPPGRELQALVDLAALICDVPTAAINIITSTHQHQIATTGVEPSVCARPDSMCAAVVEVPEPVVVPDASVDGRFRTNPFVTGEIGAVRFYASAPLFTSHDVPLGRLCVFDDRPRELSPEQERALDVLAARVVDVLELRLRSEELERSLSELTRTRDQLHRSNERLGTFAGQVSHDLRTPLTAMMLNIEFVADDPRVSSDPGLRRMLQAATDAGNRMSRMIGDILEYAQVGGDLRPEPVDLDALVGEVRADLRAALDGASGVVEVDAPLGTAVGDRPQLYAVLLNLLTNAVKFAAPGRPPHVVVRSHRADGLVRVEVSDNGVGVPPDKREHIFDLFTRADRSRPGSGIGLATVRAAVEAHGGAVGVEPVATGGTTFWFTLPVAGPT